MLHRKHSVEAAVDVDASSIDAEATGVAEGTD